MQPFCAVQLDVAKPLPRLYVELSAVPIKIGTTVPYLLALEIVSEQESELLGKNGIFDNWSSEVLEFDDFKHITDLQRTD